VILKEDNDTKNTSSIKLKTQVIISPISVTGNIVEYAEREKIDLIVIGRRGRSAFKRMLLGSTASGVVTHARCPVMVVK
jgi:nucleotide-binding universal stress UspA family protein